MIFFRLLKPHWGKKFIEHDGERVKNPEFVREVKGKNTIEGCFDEDFVQEKNKEGYNVYWFPNSSKEDVYTKEKCYLNGRDIDDFNYLFVDMDLKDEVYKTVLEFFEKLAEFKLKPTLVMCSGNGVHAYWKMKDLSRDDYVFLQKRLIKHFKTDHSIWTVLQIMRYPGSLNTKKADEFKETVIIDELSGAGPYSVKQFHKILPKLDPKEEKKGQDHLDKLDGKLSIELGQDLNADELPDRFLKILHNDEKIYQLFTNPKQTYGDKSGADAALANILFSKNFNRKEAVAIIANTQKALQKGPNRMDYAHNTVDFVYRTRIKSEFKTVGEKLKTPRESQRGQKVHGPEFFDCLYKGWRKGQVLGLIAGSGVGKTSVALKIFKDMIENNPDNDDIFIFFSLEMPEYEIEERWVNLVGKDSPLANRLYVIGNEDEKGEPRNITLQDIYWFCSDIRKNSGKNIGSVVIDHIGIVNPMINLKKEPTFQAEGDLEGGYGSNRALSMPSLCKATKTLAKTLDTFLVVLTQTTKSKGAGDTPLDKDGAFGTASYEWMMDYIITCWQPLMRIHKDTDLRVLAWQYAKIRGKHKKDQVTTHEQCLLHYDMDTGDLRPTSGEEYEEFKQLLPVANEARKAAEKRESNSYSRGPSIKDLKKLRLV